MTRMVGMYLLVVSLMNYAAASGAVAAATASENQVEPAGDWEPVVLQTWGALANAIVLLSKSVPVTKTVTMVP